MKPVKVTTTSRNPGLSRNGAWDYWSRVDSIKDGALRDALVADATGLTLVAALALTIALPALLISPSSFTQSIHSDTLSNLHYANTIFFGLSAYGAFICIVNSANMFLHMTKVPNERLLECICHVKGTWYYESFGFCTLSLIALMTGYACSVALVSGWKQALTFSCIALVAGFHLWKSVRSHDIFYMYFKDPMPRPGEMNGTISLSNKPI